MVDPQVETVLHIAELMAAAMGTAAVIVNRRDLKRYREAERRRRARDRSRQRISVREKL